MRLEGLFTCARDEAIPLKSLSVRAFLQGFVVGFRSTLTYENNSSDPLEVFFRTPIDDSHAVVGLEACIDGRNIRAKIQEKEKAKEMYEEAVSRGRTAVFGEEKKGDIFSLVLGNLPPGEKAVIQLTMVGELAVEPDGAVRFVLPMVLKPRYTPSGSTDPLAQVSPTGSSSVHHATGPPDYKFDLIIYGSPGIAEVTSPSHDINVENTGQNINVSLSKDKQTDIVILVRPKEAHKPLIIVEPGLSDGENDFQKSAVIMVSFFPEFKGDSSCLQAACEFVFVVDRSGSMNGSYIKDAAQTLLLFLKSIPEGCYFNIIGFGSSYEKLFPESVPYNQENLEKAVTHAKNLQANLGGTELFDPLKYVFSHSPLKGLPRQVFVLTDGSVSNTESVIKLVAKNSDHSRCFSFGIGSGASSTLVKGIAEAGKGAAEFITTGERMQAKVIRSLKKAMQPAVTNTQVKYTVANDATVNAIPKDSLPAIFIGERLIVYGIVRQSSQSGNTEQGQGSICLTGDLLGAKVEHNVNFLLPLSVKKDNMSQVSTIHHLAAKRMIKEMESDGDSWFPSSNPEMIKLSCDSNVISSQTAFIAIDEERKEIVKGSLQSWDILPANEHFISLSGGGGGICLGGMGFGGGMILQKSAPRAAKKKSKSAFRIPTFGMLKSGKARSSPPVKSCPFGQPAVDECFSSASRELRTMPMEFGADDEDESFSKNLRHFPGGSKANNPLPRIINLQLASGAWPAVTADLADVIEKTVAEIKESCPVCCKDDMETIWATIIVLSYLQLRQSNFKDEWELVAVKAEAWLAKQNLPEGCSIEGLLKKASSFLS